MPYLVKILEATGLGIVAIGFVASFPSLIDLKVFTLGTITFFVGWMIESLLHK